MLKRLAGLLVLALLTSACSESKKPPSNIKLVRKDIAPITNTDPCATRLQDISGDLLLYYAMNHHLPQQLSELAQLPDIGPLPEFVCPVSHQPYIYQRQGIPLPEQQSRIVLYDATPAHSGLRWAITMNDPQAGQSIIMKVIALRDSYFTSQQQP